MRVAGWRAKEVFDEVSDIAFQNADDLMDDVVIAARNRCPVSPIVRAGKWSGSRVVSFTPKTGKNKGTSVGFIAQQTWLGRNPGDLRGTIRRVTRRDRGNIRVYAGNFKIFWAFMVERGTEKTRAQPFLRPAFQQAKSVALLKIKNGR
jgi:hypothetical protein